MRYTMIVAVLAYWGVAAAHAEPSYEGRWRLAGRTCAKAGGYENAIDESRLTLASDRYVAEIEAGPCFMRKEGTLERLPAASGVTILKRDCLVRASVRGPKERCGSLYAHVDGLNRRLVNGPVCEEQAFEISQVSGKSLLLLRENGGEGLFCGPGDTQIDFLEAATR